MPAPRRLTLALAMMSCACGRAPSFPDGSNLDAATYDSTSSGPARIAVHVRSFQPGASHELAGATVEAATSDGAVTATTTTDATGRATIDAPAGGMIIVTEATTGGSDKTLIAGVGDGDALEVGDPGLSEPLGAAPIDFPPDAAASGYALSDGCITVTGGPPVDLDLYSGCSGPRTLVVQAMRSGAPGYLVARGVAIADGDDIALTGAYTDGVPATISLTGIPATSGAVLEVTRSALADGRAMTTDRARPTVTAGTATATLWAPADVSDRQRIMVSYRVGDLGTLIIDESPLGDAAIDVASQIPAVTRTGPTTWTDVDGQADGIQGVVGFRDGTGRGGRLAFTLPPDATAIPALAGLTFVDSPTRFAMIVDRDEGYAAMRARPSALTFPVLDPGPRFALRFF